jgi:hypothetical protein
MSSVAEDAESQCHPEGEIATPAVSQMVETFNVSIKGSNNLSITQRVR